MTNLTEQIHDVETGEIVVREFSAEEQAEILEAREKHIRQRQAQKAQVAEAKAAAEAKLAALGLTADDVKALGL